VSIRYTLKKIEQFEKASQRIIYKEMYGCTDYCPRTAATVVQYFKPDNTKLQDHRAGIIVVSFRSQD